MDEGIEVDTLSGGASQKPAVRSEGPKTPEITGTENDRIVVANAPRYPETKGSG